MAIEETVVINTDTKSLAALKQEISQIQAQLDLTPTGTKEYDALVVKLRQAKGEIKDFKEATKGLDPDQRAAKLVNAFQGMTGVIQAAAGAITLFGGNSEDLGKVEKNLLGIIAIGGGVQQTIEGFNDAADIIGPSFTKLGASIKGAFITAEGSVNKFRVALASIGIGLLITGLTYLITNFDELGLAIKSDADSVDELAESNEALLNSINLQNESIDAETQLLKAQGVELKKINDIKIKGLEITNQQLEQQNQELTQKIFSYYQDLNRELTEDEEKRVARLEELRTKNENSIKKNNATILNLKQEVIDENAKKEEKANADALKRQEQANADLKKLAEERRDFILDTEDGLREALQQLAIDSATTERERAQTELDNTLDDLKVAREREVAEANRLGVDVLKVNQKFDALEKDARIKFQKDIDVIDKNARDKRLAELATERNKIIDEYDKLLQQFEPGGNIGFSTTDLEQAIKKVTFLQEKYTQKQIEVNRLTRDNVITLGKGEEKGLTDREEIIKRGAKMMATIGNQIEKEIRGRQQLQVKFLSDLQIELQDSYNKSIADAAGNQIEINRLQKEYTEKYDEIENRKVAITKKAAEDIVAIRKFQADEEKNIREGIKKLDQEDIQRLADISQFYIDAAASFTSTLNTFYESAATRRTNAINEQIEAELKLAKARGASQAELEKITEDGNDRLEAEAQRTFKIQQDFAVAAALIDGASAVLRIFSNAAANPKSILFPAQPYIEAALATAFTVAKINQIKSTSLSGGGGGGFGAVGGGGGSSVSNPFSTGGFGGGGTNILPPRLAPPSGGGGRFGETAGSEQQGGVNTPIIRTYVLAGDVTDAQTAEARLNQKRKL